MCVCVCRDLSLDLFILLVINLISYYRPGTGKGSQILDTGFGIGQIQPMQSQRGLDVSDRRGPPLQSASCLCGRPAFLA